MMTFPIPPEIEDQRALLESERMRRLTRELNDLDWWEKYEIKNGKIKINPLSIRQRFLRLLGRQTRANISGADDQCWIDCPCGERLSISEAVVAWCECGRGYRTEFRVYEFPKLLRKK